MEASSEAGDSISILSQAFDGMVGVVLLCVHLLSLLGWGAHMRRSGDSVQSFNQQERCLKPSKYRRKLFYNSNTYFWGN